MDAPGRRRPGRALRRRSWLAGALSAVTAGLGCHRTPADPVAALLAELEAAAESRDADRFGARLAESFRGRGRISRTEAVAQLRRYFAALAAWLWGRAGVPPALFIDALGQSMDLADLVEALAKPLIFAVSVAVIASVCGLAAGRDPDGLGRAATRTMIGAVTAILLTDLVFVLLR